MEIKLGKEDTKQEIERKFLINLPKSWSELSELFDSLIDIKRISQSYLKETGEEQSPRIRKTVEGFKDNVKTVYHLNQKKFVEKGVNEEKEKEISVDQFESLLKHKHPDLITIDKTRYVFNYNDQIFELDIFTGPLKGLVILEIELKNKDDVVEMPPFLEVIEEVTGDKRFSNFSLAKKQLIKHL
jgi:CYTH domain-containing protein